MGRKFSGLRRLGLQIEQSKCLYLLVKASRIKLLLVQVSCFASLPPFVFFL
jgi:hypothetical protein